MIGNMNRPPNTLSAVHDAALEAMRDLAAPPRSVWSRNADGEVWHLVERTAGTVLLRLPGTRRHKSGLLATLLLNYTRIAP